ncbi:hypothetical protein [Kribbella ginsengisoli]|uniref:hypothetical protein n=1 Tax=Kribbella ginsengisoli TaxID=363865 RepID=UPI0031DB59D5
MTWNVAEGPVVPSIAAVEELLAPIWPQDFGFPLAMSSHLTAPEYTLSWLTRVQWTRLRPTK